jgi:NAD(P)-dependent dehydrogenase (short-subunit alcohol dehydrogenase family)
MSWSESAEPARTARANLFRTTVETKSVFVTGSSTGIGRACVVRLEQTGWRVFAGVRKQPDAGSLMAESSFRVTPVTIDVTDARSIAQAAEVVTAALNGSGLNGLVNNAGISVQGPLEYLPPEELRRQLEVNVIGQLAVTQALMPLIRSARGRIVMMSSISGRAMSLPLIAPYTASKTALEGLSEALRYELMPEGLHVALIEPGSIDTPIWSKGDATVGPILRALTPDGARRYSAMIHRAQILASKQARRGLPAERVARKVERALTSPRPRLRYLVGVDAHVRAYAEPLMPQPLKDLVVRRLFDM